MAIWSLSEIRQKVRQVTGRYSSQELTNKQLDEYINKYFQYAFPAELKLERFHTFYEFLTSANKKDYTLPSGYINFEPPGKIDNQSLLWYQDPAAFDENNPDSVSRYTGATGDGATVSFSITATPTPILPDTFVLTDETEVFEDTNTTYSTTSVVIAGSLGGSLTLNYSTGAVAVTFNTAPADGQKIILSYIAFSIGRPTAVILYNNKFTFYPVPDTAYRFKVKAYANSLVTTSSGTTATSFTNSTDRPLLDEWGPCIAYGAAREVHSDYAEMDAYQEVTHLYKEQLSYVLKRTNQNLLNTRAMPNF